MIQSCPRDRKEEEARASLNHNATNWNSFSLPLLLYCYLSVSHLPLPPLLLSLRARLRARRLSTVCGIPSAPSWQPRCSLVWITSTSSLVPSCSISELHPGPRSLTARILSGPRALFTPSSSHTGKTRKFVAIDPLLFHHT